MKNIFRSLTTFATAIVFISAIALINTIAVFGQKQETPVPVNVKVTNTSNEPVPVIGTVTVSNPASSPIPVQIVNQSNAPATVTGTVNVSNTENSPLLVRDLNNPAKQPVRFTGNCSVTLVGGCLSQIYIVPAGKRLVIEYVTFRALIPAGQVAQMIIDTDGVSQYLPRTPTAVNYYGGSNTQIGEKVLLYANGIVRFYAESSNITGEFFMTFSGYLESTQ